MKFQHIFRLVLCLSTVAAAQSGSKPANGKVSEGTNSTVAANSAQSSPKTSVKRTVANIFDDGQPGTLTLGGLTVYGVFDFTLAYLQHGTPPSPYQNGNYLIAKNNGHSSLSITNNALSQSTIGIKFNQPLDRFHLNGVTLTGIAQSYIQPSFGYLEDTCRSLARANGTGDVPGTPSNADSSFCGQVFNGELYAGVNDRNLGEFRYGRQSSILNADFRQYDPQELSFANSPFGIAGTYGGGIGSPQDKVWNNAIQYLNTAGPVHGAIEYRFSGSGMGGRALMIGAGAEGRGALQGLQFDGIWGHFNDAIVVSSLTSSTAATPASGSCQSIGITPANCQYTNILNATVSDDHGWAVMTKYTLHSDHLPKVALIAGYQNVELANPKHALPSGYRTIGNYALNFSTTAFTTYTTSRYLHITWAGFQWQVTKKLKATPAFYHFNSPAYVRAGARCTNPNAGTATATQCASSMTWISGVLDYQLARRLDAYTSYSYDQETGGITNGDAYTWTNNLVSGFRFRF